MLADVPMVFILVGITAYTVLSGADFGAGLWTLIPGGGPPRPSHSGRRLEATPAEPGPAKQKERKNDTTQQPEQKQERNYSQTGNQLVLAGVPLGPSVNDLPVVSVTTYRRFV